MHTKTHLLILLCTALTVLTGISVLAQEPEQNRTVTLDMKFHGALPKGAEVHTPEASSGTDAILYPEILAEEGVEGRVLLKALFAEDGSILRMEAVENGADGRLIAAAVSGLKSMPFQPGTIAGRAAEMEVMVEVAFRVEREETSFADFTSQTEISPVEEVDEGKEEFNPGDYPEFLPDATVPKYTIEDLASNLTYPEEAAAKGIEGVVYVKVYVDEEGNVREAREIKSTNAIFTETAVNAVKATPFTPAKRDGVRVKMAMVIPVRFHIAD